MFWVTSARVGSQLEGRGPLLGPGVQRTMEQLEGGSGSLGWEPHLRTRVSRLGQAGLATTENKQ